MSRVIDGVQRAFDDLSTSDAFPQKARIGVISMLPANPRALARPHPAVTRFHGIEALPGFLDLVDAQSIRAFRQVAPLDQATEFALDGCDRWFVPGARNAQGVPCLTAHTQVPLASVRAEAGLVSVEQLVARKLPGSVFRLGAAVNIIFVSDTHDPGTGPREDKPALGALLDLTPDPERLQTAIRTASASSAVRFHAIAPEQPCGERWSPAGATYLRAAQVSGGEVLDICTATDYTDFIKRIAATGAQPEHGMFPVAKPIETLASVIVDGRKTTARTRHGRVVEIDGLDARKTQTIEVHYRFTSPSPAPRRRPSGAATVPKVSDPPAARATASAPPAARASVLRVPTFQPRPESVPVLPPPRATPTDRAE
jgi:hypothetical protein